MLTVRCMFCSLEWTKPCPNTHPDTCLVSSGVCDFCLPLYEAWTDGYLSNAPLEAVKAMALRMRKSRAMKHDSSGRFV